MFRKRSPLTGRFLALMGIVAWWGSAAGDSGREAERTEILRSRTENDPIPAYFARNFEGERLWKEIRNFYRERGHQPVWVDSPDSGRRLAELSDVFARGAEHGLEPALYSFPGHWKDVRNPFVNSFYPETRRLQQEVEWELMVSHSLFRFALHLSQGRVDPVALGWETVRRRFDLAPLLGAAVEAGNLGGLLSELAPAAGPYIRLKQALSDYRRRAENGGWPELEPGPVLRRGVVRDQVISLRRFLESRKDFSALQPSSDPRLFDADVEEAVRRFQDRHGLKVDGIVGPAFRRAASATLQDRLRQIELNMERWRWLPDDLGERYLLVNIPEARLRAFEFSRPVHEMRVIVGESERQTRVFSSLLERVILNPFWYVPDSITARSTLEQLRRNPGYLREKHLEVVSGEGDGTVVIDPSKIAWARVSFYNFPYQLRQKPGPWNALGRIKFEFANRFNIYLHDTPDRHLFERPDRNFSNGCVRVEKARELARFALSREPEFTGVPLDPTFEESETRELALGQPIPIHLLYLTSLVDEEGRVYFYSDPYGHDTVLEQALR